MYVWIYEYILIENISVNIDIKKDINIVIYKNMQFLHKYLYLYQLYNEYIIYRELDIYEYIIR